MDLIFCLLADRQIKFISIIWDYLIFNKLIKMYLFDILSFYIYIKMFMIYFWKIKLLFYTKINSIDIISCECAIENF